MLLFFGFVMALQVTDAQKMAALSKGAVEFKHLLDKEGVDEDMVALLCHRGITTTRLFTLLTVLLTMPQRCSSPVVPSRQLITIRTAQLTMPLLRSFAVVPSIVPTG